MSAARVGPGADPSAHARAAVVARVNEWFAREARALPWREAGVTPWGVLVSEFMLQQTQASRVEPKWHEFIARWPRPADLAAASEADVLRAWDRLGYPRRALWLRSCAGAIVERHGGDVPADPATLLELPGIGPYTAAAVASFAFGMPEPVVDTNIRRVLARLFLGEPAAWGPSAVRDAREMRAAAPPERAAAVAWNASAMELGAVVCTARAPQCGMCPVADACAWRAAGSPAAAAPPRPRQARFAGSDREMRGRILRELRERAGGISRVDLERLAVPEGGADLERFGRSLAGLLADGLAVEHPDGPVALAGDEPAPERGSSKERAGAIA